MKRWSKEHLEFIKNTAGLLCGEAYAKFCETYPETKRTYSAFCAKKSLLNACKAENKNLKWTAEMLEFVRSTAGQDREIAYAAFREKYPEITAAAFHNQRSRSGISPKKPHGPNRRAKLYEERTKKGYIFIKVAEPNVWKSKARWVWEETHPGEPTAESDNFIFLNKNNRDFSPANIERLEVKNRTLFIKYGGADVNPEITKIRLLQAKLRSAELDLGEKIGTVKRYERYGRYERRGTRCQN